MSRQSRESKRGKGDYRIKAVDQTTIIMDCFRVFNDAILKARKNRKALLSEVRRRSRSFTEGKTTFTAPHSLPSSLAHPPPSHSGWSSSPVTPRDPHHYDPDDLIGPRSQRDVYCGGDVGSPRNLSDGVSTVVRHPRQRAGSIDDSERLVTSCGGGDVIRGVKRLDADAENGYDVRTNDIIGGVGSVPGHGLDERRVLVKVERHSRTYSDAWEEYDSGGESSQLDNLPGSGSGREACRSSERESAGDGTWVSTNADLDSGSRTGEAATARANTIPRHRPATLHSTHSHTNVFPSKPPADAGVAGDLNHDDLHERFSSSETLGRHPRGPILRYFQRTREADRSPSVSPRAFSLDSPRERTFVFPGELSGKVSTESGQLEASSSEPRQRTSSAEVVRNSTDGLSDDAAPKPSRLPTPSSQKSSTGIPQHVKKSSGIPQRSRSASQGPPQTRRTPAPPVSSAGSASAASKQNPSVLSSGIPIRPRSSSTGPNYSTRKPLLKTKEGSGISGTGGRGRKEGRVQQKAVMELAARDLRSPAMHSFLCRKTFTEHWVRYWYVLQEDSLYCYLSPDDHVTVDVTDLDGYQVTSLEDKFPGQRFVLHLEHKDYIPVYLSASSREEMEEWHAALTSAIKAIPRVNGLHLSQKQEGQGARAGQGQGEEDRALGIKQKLLAEVLRQTQELEKKQAARLAKNKQHSLEENEFHSPPSTPPPSSPQAPTGEQICALTRLRQRRMSTQIKMDTLQRQIHGNGHPSKKSRFTFGKKKSVEEAPAPSLPPPDLLQQLKTLSDHLSEIDRHLLQNSGVMTMDRKSASSSSSSSMSRGRKMTSRSAQDLESCLLEGGGVRKGGGVEGLGVEDGSVGRSNSLKSSVQKLAHRTFARAGWHRGKKSYSVDREDSEERSDHLHYPLDHHDSTTPDIIDLSRRLTRTWPAPDPSQEGEEEGELFLPPPSFFDGADGGGGADVASSPVSSPRWAGSRSSSLPRGEGSRTPRRRELDPDAMANIEAFEEMSRQILGEPT